MRDLLNLARAFRRDMGDPRLVFLHRIRVGSTVALLIFLLTHLG